MRDEVRLRPMTADDVAVAEQISDEAFHAVDLATARVGDPAPQRRAPERSQRWAARTRRLVEVDPGGCWVAEDDSGVLGFATSMVREQLWLLATYALRPEAQGRGIGRMLLDRVEEYGARCPRAMLSASEDPKALRRYHAAGFALHPQLVFRGRPDRSEIPAGLGVREATDDDLGWMDDLDRRLRGGPHGPDHVALAAMASPLALRDRSGYAYAGPDATYVVAAQTPDGARRLLWEALARAGESFEIPHVTTANSWAVDVAMAARLAMSTRGYLAVRGMAPPAPYVHNGSLL